MSERNNEQNIRVVIQSSIEPISQKLDELIEKFDSFVLLCKKTIFSDRLANELKTGDFISEVSESLDWLKKRIHYVDIKLNNSNEFIDNRHDREQAYLSRLEDRISELEAYNRIEQNYGDDEIEYVDRIEFNSLDNKVIELENDIAKVIKRISDFQKLKTIL